MDKTTQKAFKILREIKSVSVATVQNGIPDARIADVMLAEEDGLYFITARGKPYYKQLLDNKNIAVSAMNNDYVSIRIRGEILFCNNKDIVDRIFEQNPIMNKLYPGEKRDILEAFHLYRGRGEIFDLSEEHPVRERFSFGGEPVNPPGYKINDRCTACGLCLDSCPVEVISEGEIYQIDSSQCLECGRCAEVCPEGAIDPSQGI